MSVRRTKRDEVLAALRAVTEVAALDEEATGTWSGDLAEYNPQALTPSVWLCYAGSRQGDLPRSGLLKEVGLVFTVLVETHDKTASDGDGEGQALDLLEAIEDALDGAKLPTGGFVEAVGEEDVIRAELGSHLFFQPYLVRLGAAR